MIMATTTPSSKRRRIFRRSYSVSTALASPSCPKCCPQGDLPETECGGGSGSALAPIRKKSGSVDVPGSERRRIITYPIPPLRKAVMMVAGSIWMNEILPRRFSADGAVLLVSSTVWGGNSSMATMLMFLFLGVFPARFVEMDGRRRCCRVSSPTFGGSLPLWIRKM